MAFMRSGFVQVRTTGVVAAAMPELAARKMSTLLRHVREPVLFAHVMLTMSADPSVEEPATVSGTVSVNGRLVRAHASGSTMREAIFRLADRMRVRLARTWPDERARERQAQAGERRPQRRR